MKRVNETLIFLLIAFVLGSCSKNENSETALVCIDDVCIEGEWEWVESSGSIAGVTITPQTEMMERKLTIDETYYREFVDGALILETEYEYVKSGELSTFTTDSLVLKLETGNWYAVFEEGNNLILTEPCADCWSHTYTKD